MAGPDVVLPLLVVAALIPAAIARHKGRSFATYYVFGLALWIVAVPYTLFMHDRRRRCAYCAEVVQPAAVVCPHCQSAIGTAPPALQHPQ